MEGRLKNSLPFFRIKNAANDNCQQPTFKHLKAKMWSAMFIAFSPDFLVILAYKASSLK